MTYLAEFYQAGCGHQLPVFQLLALSPNKIIGGTFPCPTL